MAYFVLPIVRLFWANASTEVKVAYNRHFFPKKRSLIHITMDMTSGVTFHRNLLSHSVG